MRHRQSVNFLQKVDGKLGSVQLAWYSDLFFVLWCIMYKARTSKYQDFPFPCEMWKMSKRSLITVRFQIALQYRSKYKISSFLVVWSKTNFGC